MNKLKIEYVPISTIKPYKNNAKLHPKEQIEQIKKSMQEFGNIDPIGVWHNEVVEGHGRLEAAKQLGMETIPIIRLDDLTDEQRKVYALIHNQLTINTGFDIELLSAELEEISSIDMSEFDFNIGEGFNLDDIEEVNGYDVNNDDREYFTAAFTFPTAQKEQIMKYLRKHKQEITDEIIQKASD